MRITGLSGMDTESMVNDLMKAERMKMDKYYQSKQTSTWRQEQYNDVNKDFANFILDVSKEFGVTRRSYGSMIQSTDSLSWVKKAVSSDENIFIAKATAKGASGTHKIKVKQLADGVSVASASEVKAGADKAESTDTLENLGVTATGDLTLKFKANIDGTEKDVTVTYTKETTIKELVDKINSAQTTDEDELGIQASFDSGSGRLFLSTKKTGENAQIKVTEDAQNLLIGADNKFKIPVSGNEYLGGKTGQAAIIDFDGAKDIKYDSNQFTINGIQLDLKSKPTDTNKEFTVRVDTDVDAVYDKIKVFVEKYNEMVDKMNKKVVEKRYRDFQPLTAEQKKEMKEEDIKLWEQKAKSGLLKNDELINRSLEKMRSGLYENVSDVTGGFSQLTQIGITTGEWKDRGKLKISDDIEHGLKAAIQKDVNGVLELLFKPSSIKNETEGMPGGLTDQEKEEYKANQRKKMREQSGLINRLFDDVVIGMKEIVDKSGTGDNASLYRDVKQNILIDFVTKSGAKSILDNDILDIEKKIKVEEKRLTSKEESYWRKFSAMEKALSQLQSQSSWLAGQLGSM